MKITTQILSIPPYISTSWKNIASLHVEHQPYSCTLVATLLSGARIEIPGLEPSMLEGIFATHALYLEQEARTTQAGIAPRPQINLPPGNGQPISFDLPLKNGLAEMGSFGTLLEHNPEQANSPDLPPEVLEKITFLSKSMGVDDPSAAPKPEPHCNCPRCQIAKAMQAGIGDEESERQEPEEIVTDEELKFRTWDIEQINEKLYRVINPLDKDEHYNVFLGDPVGCTCGGKQCDHIQAVLYSTP